MKHRRATIHIDADTQPAGCVVGLRTQLHEIVEQFDLSELSHLLVKNDDGVLVGVVEIEEILSRVSAGNVIECSRWYDMPIASLLRGQMGCEELPDPRKESGRPLPETQSSIISDAAGNAAVYVDRELFVNWERVQSALQHATMDPITNLPNRSSFDRRLVEDFQRARRHRHSLAVILIDLDHFKTINDDYGHSTGDRVLEVVGAALEGSIRSYDHVARFGGDEFVIICNGCRPGEIDIPILRIGSELDKLTGDMDAFDGSLSLSIGAAVAHDVARLGSPEELLEVADQCLYRAKRDGRARACKIELDADAEQVEAVSADEIAHDDAGSITSLADTVVPTGLSTETGFMSHGARR